MRNPEHGLWRDEEAWRLRELLRIGALDGDGPEVFGLVHALEVDAYGRIYVLDRQASEIRVFDEDGAHVRTMGGMGGGPGELREATGFAWGPDWQLWVDDPRNGRYVVFDTTGASSTRVRRESGFSWNWGGAFDDAGNLYVATSRQQGNELVPVLVRLDGDGAPVDTFPRPAHQPPSFRLVRDGVTWMAVTVPFAPWPHTRVDRHGTVWFGVTDAYRLVRLSLGGDTLHVIERAARPAPVTAAERAEALDAEMYRRFRDQGGPIDAGLIPPHKPFWSGFTMDPDDGLWVFAQDWDGQKPVADVFDPDGRYLGRLSLPAGTQMMSPAPLIRGDRVYAVVQDDLGVQYVMIAAIENKGRR